MVPGSTVYLIVISFIILVNNFLKHYLLITERMTSSQNAVAKIRPQAKKAASLKDGGRLVGWEFIPLPNFQPGHSDYRNTCIIAVVTNLRGLIPAVNEVLQLSVRTWKETIRAVRAKWGQKYAHNLDFHGQDDARELLGDILWEVPASWLSCKRTTTILQCQHTAEMQHQ